MAPLDTYLKDPLYANWVKSGLAFQITNEVLRPFVVSEMETFHQTIISNIPTTVPCTECSVDKARSCPNGVCSRIKSEIENNHWYPNPSFKNTCTGNWFTDPWEIAKCYMPPSKGSKKSSTRGADFTAVINLLINCKYFHKFGPCDPTITEDKYFESKEFRNELMHPDTMTVSENDMTTHLGILIDILKETSTPNTKDNADKAIKMIGELKENRLRLEVEDILKVRRECMETMGLPSDRITQGLTSIESEIKEGGTANRKSVLSNFVEGCREALRRLVEWHIKQHGRRHIKDESLNVADFLSKIEILPETRSLSPRHENMLFPLSGSRADINKWDIFLYCFVLTDIELYEDVGNAVRLFVKKVKTIRDKFLSDDEDVTEEDLSGLLEYLQDTDLHDDIARIFNKTSPATDGIHSNNILVIWLRDESKYRETGVLRKDKEQKQQIMLEVDEKNSQLLSDVKTLLERYVGAGQVDVTEHPVNKDTQIRLKVEGCNDKIKKAIQNNITKISNNNIAMSEGGLEQFKEIMDLEDVGPRKGSIILDVKCSSVAKLVDFWNCCTDGRAVEALSKVRDSYRKYFQCDTLEFEVILTKKEVARCMHQIVEDTQSQGERLIRRVKEEVSRPKVTKGGRANAGSGPEVGGPMQTDGVPYGTYGGEAQVTNIGGRDAMNIYGGKVEFRGTMKFGGEGDKGPDISTDDTVYIEDPLIVSSMIEKDDDQEKNPGEDTFTDIATKHDKMKLEETISMSSIDAKTDEQMGEDDANRLVKRLNQISGDLEGDKITPIKAHISEMIRYSKEKDEKKFDECKMTFLEDVSFKGGMSVDWIRQVMRVVDKIKNIPTFGDLVASKLYEIVKDEGEQHVAAESSSSYTPGFVHTDKTSTQIQEDIDVDELDAQGLRPTKHPSEMRKPMMKIATDSSSYEPEFGDITKSYGESSSTKIHEIEGTLTSPLKKSKLETKLEEFSLMDKPIQSESSSSQYDKLHGKGSPLTSPLEKSTKTLSQMDKPIQTKPAFTDKPQK